ncbi:hypothetical protein EP227_06895 [bacterium]|nr:MAG: hypothetical protein EP227_06895 [bacterium]
MHLKIKEEYEKALRKRDEVRETLSKMETEEPKDSYTITITRDRLAYWEGKTEGLKFALDNLQKQ